jgi:hypothetical protein
VNSLIDCYVVKGTGRFADLMAALCKNPNMDILNHSLFREIYGADPANFADLSNKERMEETTKQRDREDKVAMYLAICRSPRLHVFDLETDSFEKLIADLEKKKSAGFRVLGV